MFHKLWDTHFPISLLTLQPFRFSDAVTWCLHNVPDGGGTEDKEDKWREDMFTKVVEPLKYCHDMFVTV